MNRSSNAKELLFCYLARFCQNPLWFFVSNFNFWLISFCVFYLKFSGFMMLTLYFLYGADIVYKLYLYKRLRNDKFDNELLSVLEKTPISSLYRMLFSLITTGMFYLGIVSNF
ncbi:MAG: hypothetical protein MR902_07820 [Campylobacter sp.]|nr:hypothetical protein [Campylobacter sp.]